MDAFAEHVRGLEDLAAAEWAEIRPIKERYRALCAEAVSRMDAEHPACRCGHKASAHDSDGCGHHDCESAYCPCLCECTDYNP